MILEFLYREVFDRLVDSRLAQIIKFEIWSILKKLFECL